MIIQLFNLILLLMACLQPAFAAQSFYQATTDLRLGSRPRDLAKHVFAVFRPP